jgi:hypothetical protein
MIDLIGVKKIGAIITDIAATIAIPVGLIAIGLIRTIITIIPDSIIIAIGLGRITQIGTIIMRIGLAIKITVNIRIFLSHNDIAIFLIDQEFNSVILLPFEFKGKKTGIIGQAGHAGIIFQVAGHNPDMSRRRPITILQLPRDGNRSDLETSRNIHRFHADFRVIGLGVGRFIAIVITAAEAKRNKRQ